MDEFNSQKEYIENLDDVNFKQEYLEHLEKIEFDSVEVSLEDPENLWGQCEALVNEMKIEKRGRNIFPKFNLVLSGLEPNRLYKNFLEFRQIGKNQYEWNKNKEKWELGLIFNQYLNSRLGSCK